MPLIYFYTYQDIDAQIIQPISVGVKGGYTVDFHRLQIPTLRFDFDAIDTYYEDVLFSGSGNGYQIGTFFEFPSGSSWSINACANFSNQSVQLRNVERRGYVILRNFRIYEFDSTDLLRVVNATTTGISGEVGLQYQPVVPINIQAGIRFTTVLTSNFEDTEWLGTKPSASVVLSVKKNPIPNLNFQLHGYLGLDADLPIISSSRSATNSLLSISPFVRLYYPLNNLESSMQWRFVSLYGGLALKIYPSLF